MLQAWAQRQERREDRQGLEVRGQGSGDNGPESPLDWPCQCGTDRASVVTESESLAELGGAEGRHPKAGRPRNRDRGQLPHSPPPPPPATSVQALEVAPDAATGLSPLPLSTHSHTFQLWRALGAEPPGSRRVLATLLAWLQERPLPAQTSDSGPQPKDKTHLRSMAVSVCPQPQGCHPLPRD